MVKDEKKGYVIPNADDVISNHSGGKPFEIDQKKLYQKNAQAQNRLPPKDLPGHAPSQTHTGGPTGGIRRSLAAGESSRQSLVAGQFSKQSLVAGQSSRQSLVAGRPSRQSLVAGRPSRQSLVAGQSSRQSLVGGQSSRQSLVAGRPSRQSLVGGQLPRRNIHSQNPLQSTPSSILADSSTTNMVPFSTSEILPSQRRRSPPMMPLESDLIKSAHHDPHVILTKTFNLLMIIFLIMIIAGAGCAGWAIQEYYFGFPPTPFSQQSYFNTLLALSNLFLVCVFSLIVLRCKIHNLGIGFGIMFVYVLTLYFALKGISRAYISIKYDDIVTIEKYIFQSNTRTEGELPSFFHRIQRTFQCCGTTKVDKMEDWPTRLSTPNMPNSCCKNPTPSCGLGLSRTYNYSGFNEGPNRISSGFFLSLTEVEMEGVVASGKPFKIVRAPKDDGKEALFEILSAVYFKSLKSVYPPGTAVASMRRFRNDIVEPYNLAEGSFPVSLGCRDDSLIEKSTIIGWEIQLELDKETTKLYLDADQFTYDWTAWKIPVCKEFAGMPPYHLGANLDRGPDLKRNVKHMWYISRGVTENFILKDLLWEKFCENEENLRAIQVPVPVSASKRKHDAVGKFYIAFVNQLMYACMATSGAVILLLSIVFLIYWKYYSRMRLEEFANLPYPPEFDVLKVRQSDLYIKHERDEYSKNEFKRTHRYSQIAPDMKATRADVTSGRDLVHSSTTSFANAGNSFAGSQSQMDLSNFDSEMSMFDQQSSTQRTGGSSTSNAATPSRGFSLAAANESP